MESMAAYYEAEAARLGAEVAESRRETILERHDESEFSAGGAGKTLGAILMIGGGMVIIATGGPVGVAIGGAMIAGGIASFSMGASRQSDAEERWIEREADRERRMSRLCPTVSTPSGRLTFSAGQPTKSAFGGARMTALDALRACRCENNPLDRFTGALPGPLGGSACQLGARLKCLRQEGDDVKGPVDLECYRLAKGDNVEPLARQLQKCSVINCGPDGMIGQDCSCYSVGGGPKRDFSRLCRQIRCPPDATPVASAGGCRCERAGGEGPGRPEVGRLPAPIEDAVKTPVPGIPVERPGGIPVPVPRDQYPVPPPKPPLK
jgi:hypothetical protein